MSEILKNKEILILVGEIAVVAGVCFYFSRKNKQLSTQLEILAKKFEEQQQLINKHEEIIHQLIQITQQQQAMLEQLNSEAPDRPGPPQHPPPKPAPGDNRKIIHMGHPQAPPVHHPARPRNTPAPIPMPKSAMKSTRPMAPPGRVHFHPPAPEEESEIEEESESELEPESDLDENLDEMLKEELLELEEEIQEDRKKFNPPKAHLKEQMKSNKKN